jgi:hypothetical protein
MSFLAEARNARSSVLPGHLDDGDEERRGRLFAEVGDG